MCCPSSGVDSFMWTLNEILTLSLFTLYSLWRLFVLPSMQPSQIILFFPFFVFAASFPWWPTQLLKTECLSIYWRICWQSKNFPFMLLCLWPLHYHYFLVSLWFYAFSGTFLFKKNKTTQTKQCDLDHVTSFIKYNASSSCQNYNLHFPYNAAKLLRFQARSLAHPSWNF